MLVKGRRAADVRRGRKCDNRRGYSVCGGLRAVRKAAYDVVVENGSGSGKYRYNDAMAQRSQTRQKQGKKFSHWEKRTGAVVSYDEEITSFTQTER